MRISRGAAILLASALPAAPAAASTVADCFKTVSGYNAFTTSIGDGLAAVTLAVEHPECVAAITSGDVSFEALAGAMIVAKEAKVFSSEAQCKTALTGPAKKALAGILKASFGTLLPASAISQLQAIADGKSDAALNSIPILGQVLSQLPCACTVAFSGLSVANLRAVITKEAKGIKACGSFISGAANSMAEAMGVGCEHPKMGEAAYFQTYLAPLLDTYALATEKERHVGCYNHPTGKCRMACENYYMSGSAGCRMAEGNALHLCDVIFIQFDQKVMARQAQLVSLALAGCKAIGDGCAMNKDHPNLVVDTWGADTLASCLGILKNTYKTPGCNPAEQPCCWRAPWPPELKCAKARAEAASKMGNLGAEIGQSFNKLPTTNADAKTIVDRQACQQAILGKTLQYVQDAACDAAAKTPTDDFSGIWPAVLSAVKSRAGGDAYTRCDGPYNRTVKINGCKAKCAQSATLQVLYHSTGPAAADQCYADCMSGAIVGQTNDPGHQQSQAQQQSSCLAQCQVVCDNAPTSVACQNCKKPGWCGGGGSSSGGSGQVNKPPVP